MARVSRSKHIPTRPAVMNLKCPGYVYKMSWLKERRVMVDPEEWILKKMKQILKVMKQTRAEVTKMEIGQDYIIVNYLH